MENMKARLRRAVAISSQGDERLEAALRDLEYILEEDPANAEVSNMYKQLQARLPSGAPTQDDELHDAQQGDLENGALPPAERSEWDAEQLKLTAQRFLNDGQFEQVRQHSLLQKGLMQFVCK
jgi:hypothetical protein